MKRDRGQRPRLAKRPLLETPHEGSFAYKGEDREKTGYRREARYAGRDADAEGRYGDPTKILRAR